LSKLEEEEAAKKENCFEIETQMVISHFLSLGL